MKPNKKIDLFYERLTQWEGPLVFNPWVHGDPENDAHSRGPALRLDNLKTYLDERGGAQYLLLAEALGYQGGHFTGIPMTSERIVLGHKKGMGIFPDHVTQIPLQRTSNTRVHGDGFNEPTASIVWKKLIDEGLDTRNFVFWNAFPWHPYKKEKGLLSNRTPTTTEMKLGKPVLEALLSAFKFKKIIALGNKADQSLNMLGIQAEKVRHPAMGGAELFRAQFLKALDR